MANDDLIRRADALRLLDENGVVFRREFEEMPAVDAIPVEWLREWQDEVGPINGWWPIIERIIAVWRGE